MYKISIIFPIYNVANYVRESLLSALNQDFKSIEFILVNDCSTDNSMDVVSHVVCKSNRATDIRIINKDKNGGLSEARNTGMEYATGDYCYFMDSDDEISSDSISLLYEKAINTDADLVVANFKLVGAKSVHMHSINTEISKFPPLYSYFKRMWSVSACNKLFKRELIVENQLKFVAGIQHEDYLWSFEYCKIASSIQLVQKETYYYKIRQGSITTSTYKDLKIRSMIYIIKQIFEDTNSKSYEGQKFIDFLKFNTALYILNYKGEATKLSYYKKLQDIVTLNQNKGIYGYLLNLPFVIFYPLIKPVYLLYKSYGSR